jgi:tetratricopeptide (TPR) repeat protein
LAAAYGGRARAYFGKGELAKALADFGEAVRLDPQSASLYLDRAAIYLAKGYLDQAIADYDKAIERDPKLAIGHNNRGLAFSARGELDKALADFDVAVRLDPKFADAFLNRANAFREKHDLERARQDLQIAIMSMGNSFSWPASPMQAGAAAVGEAQRAGVKTERERDYIAALGMFFKDWEITEHWPRAVAFKEAMAAWRRGVSWGRSPHGSVLKTRDLCHDIVACRKLMRKTRLVGSH